jgi:hypothetical protein
MRPGKGTRATRFGGGTLSDPACVRVCVEVEESSLFQVYKCAVLTREGLDAWGRGRRVPTCCCSWQRMRSSSRQRSA